MKRLIPAGLLVLAALIACEEAPPASTPAPEAIVAAQASARPTPTPLPPLGEGIIDISGCWRPLSEGGLASGAAFEFKRVSANAFVFTNQPTRTKLVFTPGGNFDEVNFDEARPFFPKGYVHSSGTVSEDGNSIERNLIGTTNTQQFRRCASVGEVPWIPPGQGNPRPTPTPSSSLSPIFLPQSPKPGPTPMPAGEPEPSATPEGQIPDTGPRAL